ncbi:MAG: hypothetical protein DRH26_01130 [Deltaproteobacteria bacterium]|nr:MAG: hypothetical protein DRH26_01130 [Deltaproteobacteria bacterium]
MSLFDNVNTSATVKEDVDFVKGQRKEPLPTDIYNLIIKYAYGEKSKGGAMGIHTVFTTPEGREIKATEYITSGDKKGNKTYYEKDKKNDDGSVTKEQFNLPGFSAIDSLCHLVIGKGILDCGSEMKTINLYDYDAKKEVPTEVNMLMELVGKAVCGAVLHQIQDKTAKNAQTGKYEPTGKTYATNVVDKFLNAADRKTASEIKNGLDGDFADKWLAKWKGQIDDQSTEVKSAGTKGAPSVSGEAAPKTSLFG